MQVLLIIFFAILGRLLIAKVKPTAVREALRYVGALLPLLLLILGYLQNDGLSILLSGVCFFYFPFLKIKADRLKR